MALMKGKIEYEVRDKYGKLVQKGKQPMHSLTQNFAWLVQNTFISFYQSATTNNIPTVILTDVTNTGQTITTTYFYNGGYNITIPYLNLPFSLNAPSGNSTYGVVIGFGQATPTPTDYKLQSQFTEGQNAGQFRHGNTTIESVSTTSTNSSFRVSRTFTNAYTAGQTVYECGLYARHKELYNGANINAQNQFNQVDAIFMIAHDALSPSVNVPTNSTLTLRYVFTFPI